MELIVSSLSGGIVKEVVKEVVCVVVGEQRILHIKPEPPERRHDIL